MVTEVTITVISPAQGAMFAPLALKFVESILSIAPWLTNFYLQSSCFHNRSQCDDDDDNGVNSGTIAHGCDCSGRHRWCCRGSRCDRSRCLRTASTRTTQTCLRPVFVFKFVHRSWLTSDNYTFQPNRYRTDRAGLSFSDGTSAITIWTLGGRDCS